MASAMTVDEFIWLPDVVEKLVVKHKVSPEEVESLFFNFPHHRFHE